MATFEGILDTCIRVTTTGDTRVTTTGDVRILSPDKRESVLASDSLAALWNAQGAVPESLGADDSIAALWEAQGVLTESVGASDSVSNVTHFYATISESVSASDALEIAWNAQGVVQESASGSDTPLVTWEAICDLAESLSADDAYVLARIYDKIISESVTALDSVVVDGIYKGGVLVIEGNDTFAVGDILYIKEGLDAEWLEVVNVDYAPSYRVTRDKAGLYADGSNPVWTQGASVVNYGQSGDGGIYVTASDTNAPYLSIFTHAGEPWNTITTHIREGNLNGYAGYTTDVYGWASYIDANNYIKIDPVNGIRMSGEITITGGGTDLDAIADGDSYARVAKTAISAGKIVLTSSGVTGTLPTALSAAKCTDATADKTSTHESATVAALTGHTLDGLANGATYGRVQLGSLNGGYVDLLRMSADSTERLLVTASGIEGYANNVKNFELASGIAYLGDQANEHIKLSSAGLQIKDGAVLYATYGATTTLGLTASEHISLSATAIQFKDGATVLTEISGGNVLVGQIGANQSNVYITSGAIQLRNNVTPKITLAADGSIALAGGITMGTDGYLRTSGKDNYADTTAGIFIGYDTDGYKVNIGNATKSIKWSATDLIVTGKIIGGTNFEDYVVGDAVIITALSDTTAPVGAYIKVKEIYLSRDGALRIKFSIKSSNGGTGKARIYRNGTGVGTERWTTSLTYDEYSQDITGWSQGDLLQIYAAVPSAAGTLIHVKDLKVSVNNPMSDGVNLD